MENSNSRLPNTKPMKQLLVPSMETISEAWPSTVQRSLEPVSLQVCVKDVHQILLASILAIYAVMTLPHFSLRRTLARAQLSPDRSLLLGFISRFWSVAIPYLQESFSSVSELNWPRIFLDTIGRFFSSLSGIRLESMIAARLSSFTSQIIEFFLLRLEAPQLSLLVQESLHAACFEIALLCRKSPKWALALMEYAVPTLRKVEATNPQLGGELGVSRSHALTKHGAHWHVVSGQSRYRDRRDSLLSQLGSSLCG